MVQEWRDYVNELIYETCLLDDINFSFGEKINFVPPIIKATVTMINQMISKGSQNNIIIIPETSQSTFMYVILSLINSVEKGIIEEIYNPNDFKRGEKIAYDGCVVEFISYEKVKDKMCLVFKTSDLDKIIAPIGILPVFSRSKAKRISSTKRYYEVTEKIRTSIGSQTISTQFIDELKKYRGHMSKSIYYVAPITKIKNKFLNAQINNTDINDILYIATANYDGEVRNICSQSLGGTPSIVLSTDLYAVREALQNKSPMQSVIIEVTKPADINNQLDALDELLEADFPITIFSDATNSFHLENLFNRGFKIWRWDENSITSRLEETPSNRITPKLLNCRKMEVQYETFEGSLLTDIFNLLSKHKESIRNQPKSISEIYDKLFNLFFTATRNIIQTNDEGFTHIMDILETCQSTLILERDFISKEGFFDYSEAIDRLRTFYMTKSRVKIDAILRLITESKITPVCIVIPEKSDKESIKKYWSKECKNHFIRTIDFLFPQEFYHSEKTDYSLTIIVGWFNELLMQKILYSYNSKKYIILLYDHERRWKEGRVYSWAKKLNISDNKEIVENIFSKGRNLSISTSNFEPKTMEKESETPSELEDIELILNFNKYQKYVEFDKVSSTLGEIVDVIPINFIGGFIAFFKETHQIICVTLIVNGESDKIEIKHPDELEVGDFVVVRESNSDVIKEIADILLEKNGQSQLRGIAAEWSDALNRFYCANGFDHLYMNLIAAECHVTRQAVWGWINGLTIIPRNKSRIGQIATAIGDATLLNNKEDVYEAGKHLRNVHQRAGRFLSNSLKNKLPSTLHSMVDFNLDNIFEPITIDLEDIGTITILKIIDMGNSIKVHVTDVNRFIKEI